LRSEVASLPGGPLELARTGGTGGGGLAQRATLRSLGRGFGGGLGPYSR
jgi:hypothetical protein